MKLFTYLFGLMLFFSISSAQTPGSITGEGPAIILFLLFAILFWIIIPSLILLSTVPNLFLSLAFFTVAYAIYLDKVKTQKTPTPIWGLICLVCVLFGIINLGIVLLGVVSIFRAVNTPLTRAIGSVFW